MASQENGVVMRGTEKKYQFRKPLWTKQIESYNLFENTTYGLWAGGVCNDLDQALLAARLEPRALSRERCESDRAGSTIKQISVGNFL